MQRETSPLEGVLSSWRVAGGFRLVAYVFERGIEIETTEIPAVLVCLLSCVPLNSAIHLVDG